MFYNLFYRPELIRCTAIANLNSNLIQKAWATTLRNLYFKEKSTRIVYFLWPTTSLTFNAVSFLFGQTSRFWDHLGTCTRVEVHVFKM